MSIFNKLFGKQKSLQASLPNQNPEEAHDGALRKEDFIDDSEPALKIKDFYTVEIGTRMPIDVIYNYLKKDFGPKGYADAITNPDKSYRDLNLSIIKSNLEIKFNECYLKYRDLLKELDYHIRSRQESGLHDLADMIMSRKVVYESHLEELQKMQEALSKGELYMTGILKSYEVGFTKGLASITLDKIDTSSKYE